MTITQDFHATQTATIPPSIYFSQSEKLSEIKWSRVKQMEIHTSVILATGD